MKNSDTRNEKLFLGLGIIVIIAGIVLAFENPAIGIPGSIVGVWLAVENLKKIKSKRKNIRGNL